MSRSALSILPMGLGFALSLNAVLGSLACSPVTAGPSERGINVQLPTASSTSATDSPPLDEPVVVLQPPVPLGRGIIVRPFTPGHFAGLTHYYQYSSCSRSWSIYRAQTSLVLDLEADHTVTGCRGKRSHLQGGARHDSDENYRSGEQQGLSGTWKQDGAWLIVELDNDDDICAQKLASRGAVPQPWKLRCLAVEPKGHKRLFGPALACQLADQNGASSLGFAIYDVLPGGWIFLGRGPGLVSVWRDDELTLSKVVSVEPAARAVESDAWKRPFPKQRYDMF